MYGHLFSFRARIVPLYALMAVTLGAMPFIPTYLVSIAICSLIGFAGNMASGSVFGMAALFSPQHISALMTGSVLD